MSNDQDRGDGPPTFGSDDDNNDNETSMYASAISPGTVDVSLSGADDEDDENPFGLPPPSSRPKTSTNTTNTVESSTLYPADSAADKTTNDDDDDDVFGVNKQNTTSSTLSVPPQVPIAVPNPQPSSPIKQEAPVYENLNTSSPQTTTTTYNSQTSSSSATANKPSTPKRSPDDTIEITVSDPTKVGDVSFID